MAKVVQPNEIKNKLIKKLFRRRKWLWKRNKCLWKYRSNYNKNERFSVYGFTARIKGQNEVNHCFNINFTNNPEIEKIDSIIREYYNSFNNLKLDRPFFYPLINKVIDNIKKEKNKYHILLILTVDVIDDKKNTIDDLVEASSLSLSVIIIGIDNENLQAMKELDGVFKPLISSNSQKGWEILWNWLFLMNINMFLIILPNKFWKS